MTALLLSRASSTRPSQARALGAAALAECGPRNHGELCPPDHTWQMEEAPENKTMAVPGTVETCCFGFFLPGVVCMVLYVSMYWKLSILFKKSVSC